MLLVSDFHGSYLIYLKKIKHWFSFKDKFTVFFLVSYLCVVLVLFIKYVIYILNTNYLINKKKWQMNFYVCFGSKTILIQDAITEFNEILLNAISQIMNDKKL